MNPPHNIIVGIPGKWPSRAELGQAILRESMAPEGGFTIAGKLLTDLATGEKWEIHVNEHHPGLAKAFEVGGRGSVTAEDVEAIAGHTFIAYLLSDGPGSLDAAHGILKAAGVLLRAGRLGVNVESAGRAYSPKDWFILQETGNPAALFDAFVTLIRDEAEGYSCGMHNLGLADAIVPLPGTEEDSARLLRSFLTYTLIEKPDLHPGHTFSRNPQSTNYRLSTEPCTMYEEDDPFFNPHGFWRLTPI